jgi:hypothetical protein
MSQTQHAHPPVKPLAPIFAQLAEKQADLCQPSAADLRKSLIVATCKATVDALEVIAHNYPLMPPRDFPDWLAVQISAVQETARAHSS